MHEASRTHPPTVRFSGLFEMSFWHRKWHEARMEPKQNCKIRYGLKTCTVAHSVREGSRTWRDLKTFLAVPYYFVVCGESFFCALLSPCIK